MKPHYYINWEGRKSFAEKHPNLQSAMDTASEYAENSPGEAYEILQCIGIVQAQKPSTFWMDGFWPPLVVYDPQLPYGLPPLPELPDGYGHWEYRGMGWSGGRACYSFCAVDDRPEWIGPMHGMPFGIENYHYIEAVK